MQRGRERHKDSKAGRPIELELDQFVENTSSRKLPAEKRSPKKFLPCFSRNTSEKPRTIPITGSPNKEMRKFPKNIIRNQKYSLLTFIPLTLWEQFNYFINFYYLVISLSQLIPALKVGFLFTYIAPLILVVALSMMKEAYDDIKRMRRDKAVNSEKYEVLVPTGRITAPASDLVVGNFVRVKANQRIPADMILLRTTNDSGASFIRTDQLDGETDWKLRRAVNYTQELSNDEDLFRIHGEIFADKPITDIYKFVGNLIIHPGAGEEDYVEPLGLDQTLWSSTVLAADSVIGVVVYTGEETRSVINTRQPSNKKGRLDEEVNFITILLCVVQVAIAISLTVAGLFKGVWWLNFFRYIILIAGIIPISMRVNLDFAKLVYAYSIKKDPLIPNCVARNTSIPEECGRISYLLSDKTGTLTQNDMIFKKLHLGSYNFNSEAIGEIADALETHYGPHVELSRSSIINARARSQLSDQVYKMISAAALCHNVSITREEDPITGDIKTEYQAASPDEVALVKFSESVGLTLHDRSLHTITLMNPQEEEEVFEIIECFPFSSARKRMGIILKNQATGEIRFLMKGADVVMTRIVQESEWLEEECTNLAREGLRTLVFGHKILTEEELAVFQEKLQQAQSTIEDREGCVERVIDSLEANLELLGLTGVEDKLQVNVRQTLEVIRCAGIKIWMLTGDKRETATCIGISSKLIARNQIIYQMDCSTELEAMNDLNEFASLTDTVLIIDGDTLAFCLATKEMADLFFHSTKSAPAVVCCRCSPTQKAEVVELIRKNSSERVAAIGDGGNDVSMIQAAHIGIGIEGKEGRQAALAADYSIEQFSHIGQLFLWHGRNAYHRSALISQVIAYRGMAISFMQTLYCAVFYMAPVSLYTGMLVFGYSCWYTMFPVFALVSDRDITPEDSLLYPELYQETRKGHILSPKTFSLWALASIVQAMILFYCAIFLISKPINYIDFESVTFTALIFVELLSFALVIKTWNILLLVSLVSTVALYPLLMIILTGYYHIQFIASWAFWWKALTLTFVAMTPVYLVKKVVDVVSPRTTSKIS